MGLTKEVTEDTVERIEGDTFGKILGHSPTVKLSDEIDRTFMEQLSNEYIINPIDKALLGTTLAEFQAPVGDPDIDIQYQSRVNPAVVRRTGQVEEKSKQEFLEEDILSSSKRNRLKINLTGGADTPTAGVGVTTATPTGTGLKVG